jgi:ATP-binding cassette subfamily C protein
MHAFLAGRTTLIIAHRLSAVREADRILVFENGRVVEDGDHDALIERDGLYRKLYRHA